ncbi:hypothetical protein ACH42_05340 [Endozoicomonas sp. (ex Bugula neritina AB1)]|nr:hypothetical protein ACH42_05340 [Endozoicomonas sp. (ex Bugula neritina AB1)]
MDKSESDTVITEELLPGDLLFQLRSGGEVEWVISRIFAGRGGVAINHVGIYAGDGQVIEAVMPKVRKTSIEEFKARSVLDNHQSPCILVCRVRSEYSPLVVPALEFAENTLSHPYDTHYSGTKKSWYCSELIVDSFRHANQGEFLFQETPMSFRDMDSGELLPYWGEHYRSIGQEVPEGLPGSHPALLSRSDIIVLVKNIGGLPAKEGSLWTGTDSRAMLV